MVYGRRLPRGVHIGIGAKRYKKLVRLLGLSTDFLPKYYSASTIPLIFTYLSYCNIIIMGLKLHTHTQTRARKHTHTHKQTHTHTHAHAQTHTLRKTERARERALYRGRR